MPSGRPFKFDVGKGSRDRAVGAVETKLRGKMASAAGSKKRWEQARARAAAGASGPLPPAAPPPDAPTPPPAAPRVSDDDLRAKLLGLGDAQPIAADEVIPPDSDGAAAGKPPDEVPFDDEMDSEGQDMIASLLAKGATLGLVYLANRPLRRRKPPMEGEAHEKGLEYFHDGIEHVARKIVGKTATLGPTAKIFVGAIIIVGSIHMTAEPIPGAQPYQEQQAAPPPPPPQAPPVAPHATNGAAPPPPQPPPPNTTALALGVFGVEKMTAN